MSKRQIQFYDDFVDNQIKTAFNERQIEIIKRTKTFIKNNKPKILEVGCGIGIMSFMLAKEFPNAHITAVDISKSSIDIAKRININNKNIDFIEGNLLENPNILNNFEYFDYILFFDVIEHIPLEKHAALFEILTSKSNDNTKLVFTVPNYQYTAHCKKNNPSVLQIVDEEIFVGTLCETARLNHFYLRYLDTYDIWIKNEYYFLYFEKQIAFQEVKTTPMLDIFNRIKRRFYYKKMIKNIKT